MKRTLFLMHFFAANLFPSNIDELQPHVTFLARVQVPEAADLRLFLQQVREKVEQVEPFTLIVGDTKKFGDENSKPVFALEDPERQAANFHEQLLTVAEECNFTLQQPDFAGDNFIPHVTKPVMEASPLNLGDQFVVDSLTISMHVGEQLFQDVHTLDVISFQH